MNDYNKYFKNKILMITGGLKAHLVMLFYQNFWKQDLRKLEYLVEMRKNKMI